MAFPTTGTLDSFTRADESTLSGGWTVGAQPGVNSLQVISNACTPQTGPSGTSGQTWNTQFGPDMEVFATIANTVPADGAYWGIWLRCNNMGVGGSASGYQIPWIKSAGTDTPQVWRMTAGGSFAQVTNGTLGSMTQEYAVNDGIGASIVGNTITVYYRSGLGGSWTAIGTGTDASPLTGTGYIGLDIGGSNDTSDRLDDFGGGTVVTAITPAVAWLTA